MDTVPGSAERRAPSTLPRLPVPAVTHEEHSWRVRDDGLYSRSERSRGSGTYWSAVPARTRDLQIMIPSDLASEVSEATAALVEFDSYAGVVLGAGSSTLGPMSSILLRTESASSSQIENLTVGARQLATAELDESASTNAHIVVANVRAMEAALRLADRLDEQSILAMHAELLQRHPGWEQHAGVYRSELVWVGASAASPIGATHVAPQACAVPHAMDDLVALIARTDLPTLVHAAIVHAQFETIHPFVDGNGRTGRALVHAMLRAHGLLKTTTAPVSAGLLTDTRAYFDALTSFRDGDARPIVEAFVRASRFAASTGQTLVDDLARQVEQSTDMMTGLRRQATAWQVLPHLVAHPVINARYLTEHLGLNPVAAQRALGQLTDAGVLEERTGARRNRVWQHPGILDVLDAYAGNIRRTW